MSAEHPDTDDNSSDSRVGWVSYNVQVTLTGEPTQEHRPRYKREEWLREQYVVQGKNTYEIADMAGCHSNTVGRYLNKYDIEIRTRGGQTSDKLRDKGWLHEQYIEQGKNACEIADIADCSKSSVHRYLEKHGIETRKRGRQPPDKLRREGWLHEQYVEERKNMEEIADMADCSVSTTHTYLNKHDIETRNSPVGLSGADNVNYAGGRSEYGPGWTDEKKRAVRERDGNACRNCGMSQEQHRRQHDERLHVHHIKKAREFDDADKRNDMSNLVTLCRECHLGHFERMADTGLQPQIPGVNYPNE